MSPKPGSRAINSRVFLLHAAMIAAFPFSMPRKFPTQSLNRAMCIAMRQGALVKQSRAGSECVSMLQRFRIVPGKNWGTADTEAQRRWDRQRCNCYFERACFAQTFPRRAPSIHVSTSPSGITTAVGARRSREPPSPHSKTLTENLAHLPICEWKRLPNSVIPHPVTKPVIGTILWQSRKFCHPIDCRLAVLVGE